LKNNLCVEVLDARLENALAYIVYGMTLIKNGQREVFWPQL